MRDCVIFHLLNFARCISYLFLFPLPFSLTFYFPKCEIKFLFFYVFHPNSRFSFFPGFFPRISELSYFFVRSIFPISLIYPYIFFSFFFIFSPTFPRLRCRFVLADVHRARLTVFQRLRCRFVFSRWRCTSMTRRS